MSWDLFAMRFPPGATSIDDVPGDYDPPEIAPRADLVASVLEIAPATEFAEGSRGMLDLGDGSIEFSLGSEPVHSIAMRVRGGGTQVLDVVAAVLERLSLRAVDAGSGEFFDAEASRASWERFQSYRDRATGDSSPG